MPKHSRGRDGTLSRINGTVRPDSAVFPHQDSISSVFLPRLISVPFVSQAERAVITVLLSTQYIRDKVHRKGRQ
jgi:hypothetical protein